MKPKNKETLSSPGRRGFLTSPVHSAQLILNFTINAPKSYPGAFSFKQILGLSKFLDPLFQARRGSKPRLPGLGSPKSDEKPKTK